MKRSRKSDPRPAARPVPATEPYSTGRGSMSDLFERVDHLFNAYVDKSCGMVDPEGIESMCTDIDVEHTDARILMLAWKMQAAKQGYFTLEEWRRGLRALKADTTITLKKSLTELEKEVAKPENFDDFYTYAFRYCLTDEKQKSVDIESICLLLNLTLGTRYRDQTDALIEYLKSQKDYRVINMDQWMSFLRFCQEVNFPSLDNYDPSQAWPLILDNFVETLRVKQS